MAQATVAVHPVSSTLASTHPSAALLPVPAAVEDPAAATAPRSRPSHYWSLDPYRLPSPGSLFVTSSTARPAPRAAADSLFRNSGPLPRTPPIDISTSCIVRHTPEPLPPTHPDGHATRLHTVAPRHFPLSPRFAYTEMCELPIKGTVVASATGDRPPSASITPSVRPRWHHEFAAGATGPASPTAQHPASLRAAQKDARTEWAAWLVAAQPEDRYAGVLAGVPAAAVAYSTPAPAQTASAAAPTTAITTATTALKRASTARGASSGGSAPLVPRAGQLFGHPVTVPGSFVETLRRPRTASSSSSAAPGTRGSPIPPSSLPFASAQAAVAAAARNAFFTALPSHFRERPGAHLDITRRRSPRPAHRDLSASQDPHSQDQDQGRDVGGTVRGGPGGGGRPRRERAGVRADMSVAASRGHLPAVHDLPEFRRGLARDLLRRDMMLRGVATRPGRHRPESGATGHEEDQAVAAGGGAAKLSELQQGQAQEPEQESRDQQNERGDEAGAEARDEPPATAQ